MNRDAEYHQGDACDVLDARELAQDDRADDGGEHPDRGGSVAWLFPGLVLLGAGQGLCITLAFERSLLQMGALLLVVAALTRLMPGRQRTA